MVQTKKHNTKHNNVKLKIYKHVNRKRTNTEHRKQNTKNNNNKTHKTKQKCTSMCM